jgi:PAS domain S-box-containing protein
MEITPVSAHTPHTPANDGGQPNQDWQAAQLHTFASLIEYAPDAFVVANLQGLLTYINPAFKQLYGYGDEALGMPILTFFPESEHMRMGEILQELQTHGHWSGALLHRRKDGQTFIGQETAYFIRDPDGTPLAMAAIVRDITAQQQAENELRALQEQVIASQQAALAELSTPLIPISDTIVVMPLIGAVDSRRAQQVMETLLVGIAERGAEIAILDITGVSVVDTQVANALVRAAQAVKLLGAEVILTGIRSEVAQTLVALGADLNAITTRSSLQSGIAYATGRG